MSSYLLRALSSRKRQGDSVLLHNIIISASSRSIPRRASFSILASNDVIGNAFTYAPHVKAGYRPAFSNASIEHKNHFKSLSYKLSFSTARGHLCRNFCSCSQTDKLELSSSSISDVASGELDPSCLASKDAVAAKKVKVVHKKPIDFTKLNVNLLPTVILVGRPNVGKSALFNRLIRRREALVYNTPDDHVTRDIREGIAKLGDLRFRVLDSAGLETEATSGSILQRTSSMTANVLAKTHFAVFIIDARAGLHPLDMEVGKWLRKNAPGMIPIVVLNKAELLFDGRESFSEAADEVRMLGFGDPIAISAETGLGMTALHEALRPLLEEHVLQVLNSNNEDDGTGLCNDSSLEEGDDSKLPLQLAIVGRPNVGKSTLLNALLQEERVLVGPEAGLTRDSVRAQFDFQGRTVYLVDTAGWLHRTKDEKRPSSLSIMQSKKNLMRAHVIVLVLDAEQISEARRSMTHAEVVIARRAVEEGRGLVVVVNKMDLLNGRLCDKVMETVPLEIQTVIPQVTGIPVVFTSAIEGKGRIPVMRQVIETYGKWCTRLSTARLNRWIRKVMSRHSWKGEGTQPKIKYLTQVKARPPTFVAFTSGKKQLSEAEIRFLTKSLKEDFDLGGIPIRIMERCVPKSNGSGQSSSRNFQSTGRTRIIAVDNKTVEA
ncbi:GTPase Der [Linum grandiflorum]